MRFLSKLKEYGSQTIDWAKKEPRKVAVRSTISIFAGIGVGVVLAPVSLGVGVACGIGFCVGAAIVLNNDGIKNHQNTFVKKKNAQLAKDNAQAVLDLATERAKNASHTVALAQNAQALSNKDARILELEKKQLEDSARTIKIVQPASKPPTASPLNENPKVSDQSMYTNTTIRKRQKTKADNTEIPFETNPSSDNGYSPGCIAK